jgi:hypothetical protein
MDMSTMRNKLDAGEYPNATKFFEDFKLMIRNYFIFNPSGTHVNQAGIDLQRLFDEKWKHLHLFGMPVMMKMTVRVKVLPEGDHHAGVCQPVSQQH